MSSCRIAQLASGQVVFCRQPEDNHIHIPVRGLLVKTLQRIFLAKVEFSVVEANYGNIIIGKTWRVQTSCADEIAYAQRKGRKGLTRFVKNREPENTSFLTVVLIPAFDMTAFVLLSAYLGQKAEPEPWDKHRTQNSLPFWQNNALIWGYEQVVPGTETKECPW